MRKVNFVFRPPEFTTNGAKAKFRIKKLFENPFHSLIIYFILTMKC